MMNTTFFIEEVIRYKKLNPRLLMYFLGFHIYRGQSKLELFKRYIVDNLFVDDIILNQLIDIFCEIQKIYFAFNRFIYLFRIKQIKNITNDSDLCLQKLQLFPETEKITLYHMNKLYEFRLKDLIHMWKQNLVHSDYLFPTPQSFKNPYTNIPFKEHHLYNIYFAIQSQYIPFYISEFFNLNFSYDLFKIKYNPLLKEVAISNRMDTCDIDELYIDIQAMCEKLNELYGNEFRVNTITNTTQKYRIVNTLKPYLQLFYHYSYSRNSLLKKHCMRLLRKEIKLFFEANSLFGRRLVFVSSKNKFSDAENPIITLTPSAKKFIRHMRFF